MRKFFNVPRGPQNTWGSFRSTRTRNVRWDRFGLWYREAVHVVFLSALPAISPINWKKGDGHLIVCVVYSYQHLSSRTNWLFLVYRCICETGYWLGSTSSRLSMRAKKYMVMFKDKPNSYVCKKILSRKATSKDEQNDREDWLQRLAGANVTERQGHRTTVECALYFDQNKMVRVFWTAPRQIMYYCGQHACLEKHLY